MKTSDFYGQNIGTFEAKVRHFYAKKSDVFNFRKNALFWRGGKVWNGGAQQATEGQRQEGRGTAYFLPFGRSQHEFPPVALFAQIYGFYPTFGRNLTDFCPNLWFLTHIWAKLVCFRQNYRVTLLCPFFCKNQSKKRESLVVRHRINRQALFGFRFSEYFCSVKYNVES